MTVLSWVAGFQVRTGWRFLSAAESSRLSEAVSTSGHGPFRVIARRGEGRHVVCLDATEPDPLRARVFVLRSGEASHAHIEEEHASLAAWVRALGLTSSGATAGIHGGS